jgi:hypothetical protein
LGDPATSGKKAIFPASLTSFNDTWFGAAQQAAKPLITLYLSIVYRNLPGQSGGHPKSRLQALVSLPGNARFLEHFSYYCALADSLSAAFLNGKAA